MAHLSGSTHARRQAVLGDRGRLVLPADVRKELGLEKGSRFQVIAENDGSLTLRPYAAIARATRGSMAHLADPDVSIVDELIAERREEARRENEGV